MTDAERIAAKAIYWEPIICRDCGVNTHPKVDQCDACYRIADAERRRAMHEAEKSRPRIKGVRL